MMNRAARRKRKALARSGVPIFLRVLGHTVNRKTVFYWLASEEYDTNLTPAEALQGGAMHGPYDTEAEAIAAGELAIAGDECKIKEGGMWDPSWSKPQ